MALRTSGVRLYGPPKAGKLAVYFVLFLAVSFLSGCITGSTHNTQFYILNPLNPDDGLASETGNTSALSIEIVSLRLPQYLKRPQIVTRSSDNRLEFAEFHRWGGNLQKNMSRVLAKNLSQLLAVSDVAISPYHSRIAPDFTVDADVLQFERGADGAVRLSVRWRLSSKRDPNRFVTRVTDLVSPEPLKKNDFENTVSEMSRLFGELSRIIGQEILKLADGE